MQYFLHIIVHSTNEIPTHSNPCTLFLCQIAKSWKNRTKNHNPSRVPLYLHLLIPKFHVCFISYFYLIPYYQCWYVIKQSLSGKSSVLSSSHQFCYCGCCSCYSTILIKPHQYSFRMLSIVLLCGYFVCKRLYACPFVPTRDWSWLWLPNITDDPICLTRKYT